jgi:hypothetical protein
LKRVDDCWPERSELPDNLFEAHLKENHSLSSSDWLKVIVLLPDFSSASFNGQLVASVFEKRLSHDFTKVIENLPSWDRPKLPAQSSTINSAMNTFFSMGAQITEILRPVWAMGCGKIALLDSFALAIS